ncbi:MAG: SWIM zinc finger family protein, partial [Actinomycetota bacterium]
AWIDALESQARLDPSRLPRGRTYARSGRVTAVSVEPGSIRALVKGSRPEPYHVEIAVPAFTDDEWGTVFDMVVSRADHTAALLDSELDPILVDDLAAVGVHLLPRGDELSTWCSCPDWAEPCKHASAVCYLAADEFDADPFALLRLRGRTREQILAAVRRLRTAGAPAATSRPTRPVDEGVAAAEAWARLPGPLPAPPALRPNPARPAAQSVDPPADATFTADGLRTLATDAAARAWSALAEHRPLHPATDVEHDIVRRAAAAGDDDGLAPLARRLGTSPQTLRRRALAWELAGPAGLAMLEERKWRADPLVMSAARLAVEEVVRGHVRGDIDGNRLTLGDVQLRLARTGDWWVFERQGPGWEPTGGPAADPEELIDRRTVTGR